MTILFDATARVKPAGNRRFGAGLLAYAPTTRITHTVADEAEYCQMQADLEQARRDYNAHLEERYERFLQMDMMSRGIASC